MKNNNNLHNLCNLTLCPFNLCNFNFTISNKTAIFVSRWIYTCTRIHIKISRNFAVRSGEEDLSSIYMNDVSKSDHLIDIAGLSRITAQEHTSLALCIAHPAPLIAMPYSTRVIAGMNQYLTL